MIGRRTVTVRLDADDARAVADALRMIARSQTFGDLEIAARMIRVADAMAEQAKPVATVEAR